MSFSRAQLWYGACLPSVNLNSAKAAPAARNPTGKSVAQKREVKELGKHKAP